MDDLTIIADEICRLIENGGLFAAMNLYQQRLGEFRGLGWRRAEYRLGLRITEAMAKVGGVRLEGTHSLRPWYDCALFHLALGNLKEAEKQFHVLAADLAEEREDRQTLERAMHSGTDDWMDLYEQLMEKRPHSGALGRISAATIDALFHPAVQQGLSDVMLAQGRLIEAERYAHSVIHIDPNDPLPGAIPGLTGASPYGRRAAARFLLGKVEEAWSDLEEAEGPSPNTDPSAGMPGAYRIQLLTRQGQLGTAARLLKSTDGDTLREECPLLWANYSLCQAELHLARREPGSAQPIVDQVVEWAEYTGHQETWIRATLAGARKQMQEGAMPEAGRALEEVNRVSRDRHFRIWLIEGLVLEGHRHLLESNLVGMEEAAQEAIALSADPETNYLWGEASGAHLTAEIRFRQGQMEAARTYAERACALRTALGDARIHNSRALLEKVTE